MPILRITGEASLDTIFDQIQNYAASLRSPTLETFNDETFTGWTVSSASESIQWLFTINELRSLAEKITSDSRRELFLQYLGTAESRVRLTEALRGTIELRRLALQQAGLLPPDNAEEARGRRLLPYKEKSIWEHLLED